MPYACAVNFPNYHPPTNVVLNIFPNAQIPDGVGYTVTFASPISQSTSATTPNTASVTFPASQIPSNDTIDFTFIYNGCSSPSKGSGTVSSGAGVYPVDLPYMTCASVGTPPPPPPPPPSSTTYLYYLIGGLSVVAVAVGGIAYFKGKVQSGSENKLISLLKGVKSK